MSTILLLLALTACDRPPEEKKTEAEGPVMAMQQPPEALMTLDLGPSFVASVWGPDVGANQVEPFAKAAGEASLKEAAARRQITEAQLALTTSVAGDAAPADLDTRAVALVKAERELANAQVDSALGLFSLLDATQLENRAKSGLPRILLELAQDHPVTREPNPFARVRTDRFEEPELADALKLKTEVLGCLVGYQQEVSEATVEVSKVDLRAPGWTDGYRALTTGVLDAWEECRLAGVQRFTHFVAKMPKERRARFMLDDGFVDALRLARGGSAGGKQLPEGGRPPGAMVPRGPGGPGGPPGGPGGPAMPGGPGMEGPPPPK
ncbi:MAG: hypothetical protein ACOZNI_05605 [Myxococcota bacterium]